MGARDNDIKNDIKIEDIDLEKNPKTIEDLMRDEIKLQADEVEELRNLLDKLNDDLNRVNENLRHKEEELSSLNSKMTETLDDMNKLKDGIEKREEALIKKQRDLADEKRRFERNRSIELERQKQSNLLIETKLKRLEEELFKLSVEKERLERDRQKLELEKNNIGKSSPSSFEDAGKLFFYGAMDEAEIKSRYRALIKIYHPDNTKGTTNMAIRIINHEYERLRGIYKSINSYK